LWLLGLGELGLYFLVHYRMLSKKKREKNIKEIEIKKKVEFACFDE
jgi:hypothetical protein